MDIKTFVTTTLREIIEGIEDAATEVKQETSGDGAVNPVRREGRKINNIDFDLAVTTSETAEAGGGIKVMGIGATGGLATEASTVSRIKFQVPVRFPLDRG